ncbi:MAG: enoyl-CoA hydratase/isomerase family protein, partial [Dehalococcoidia bacterium]
FETLLLDRTEHKVTVTLNRPDKLNAITVKMARELRTILTELNEDPDARVLILTGAGRGFCSGAELSRGDKEDKSINLLDPLHEVIRLMRSFKSPIIGAINGVAAGAGFSLSLACDIRIASEESRYSAIFVRRALSVDCGLSYTLPRVIGLPNALHMMYTGEIIDASTAEKMGLVSRVVPQSELLAATDELATAIANGPPLAISGIRRSAYSALDSSLDSALDLEKATNNLLSGTEDAAEGVRSFLEKRPPVFTGRLRERSEG